MIIVEDFLTPGTFRRCQKELKQKLQERCWTSSCIAWADNVKKGITGSTLVTGVSDELKVKLEKELRKYLPDGMEEVKVHADYYVWQYNAGISGHTDQKYKFGATLYLNDEWFVNSGGLFVWEDSETGKEKVHVPTRNVLVLNTKHEEHMVTPVTIETFDFRYTIQMWGL